VPADCVLHPSLAEFSVSADHNRLTIGGPHRQLVILGAGQASRACCPALVATLPQHASYCGVHIVIKEESH
jgi:hypothetical protein